MSGARRPLEANQRNVFLLITIIVITFFLIKFFPLQEERKPVKQKTLYTSDTDRIYGISTAERIQLLDDTWNWQEKYRQRVWNSAAQLKKFDTWRWVYYLWPPIPGACHLLERVGTFDDGGKFQCNLYALNKPCVVYSFGIYEVNEEDYDQVMAQKWGCEVYGFDPTVTQQVIDQYESAVPGSKAYPWALGPISKAGDSYNWEFENYIVKSLGQITSELKHTKVDILKIDIEKAEHAVIPFMLKEPGFKELGITQIALELHFLNLQDMRQIFDSLHEAGYYPIANEKNYRCDTCIEYLFVHRDLLAKSPPSRG